MASLGIVIESADTDSHPLSEEETALQKKQTNPLVFKRAHTVMLTNDEMSWFDDYYVKQEPLGEPGTFGMAFRCYKRGDPNKTNYAVKQINKAKFYFNETKGVLDNMKNEIEVMTLLSTHNHIVTLYETYEDRNYIYYILDCLSGGELFARIEETDGLTETCAASISKQILSAIQFMQQHNVAHLDLKPDNILFVNNSPDSAIKIIDFGEARFVGKNETLNVKIGTPFYMAPEIINGEYHPFAADIWSVGVIIFCMLFGYVPFHEGGDDEEAIFALIKKGFKPQVQDGWGPFFPKDLPISNEAMDLLSNLLTSNAQKRLNVKQCLNHSWINGNITAPAAISVISKQSIANVPHRKRNAMQVSLTETEEILSAISPKSFADGIVKKGYLMKEGKLFKSWKKRYFKLWNTGIVSYYAFHEDSEPIAEFSIDSDIKIIKSKKISHGFIICTLERNWKLICPNDKERDLWIATLMKVSKTCNKMNIMNAMERSLCIDSKDAILVNGFVRELQHELQIKIMDSVINIISLLYYGYQTERTIAKQNSWWENMTVINKPSINAVKNYKFGDLTKGIFRKLSGLK